MILFCLWEIDVSNGWKGGILPSPVFHSKVANPPLSWLVWIVVRSLHCNVFHFLFHLLRLYIIQAGI